MAFGSGKVIFFLSPLNIFRIFLIKERENMEQLYESVTLKNAGDVIDARRGFIKESQIRKVTIMATVETQSQVLFISDDVRQKLGLKVLGGKNIQMADGTTKTCTLTDMLEVHRRTSHTYMSALVFPGVNAVLLVSAPRDGIILIANKKPMKRRYVSFFRR
jgi:hypothetical protein